MVELADADSGKSERRRKVIRDSEAQMEVELLQLKYVAYIGVNISERKSGTERTKKRKKRELIYFPNHQGGNWYFSTSSRRYKDFATVTIIWDIFIPGPYAAQTKSQLNKQAKNAQFNNFAELALPSTGSWLPSRLSSTLP